MAACSNAKQPTTYQAKYPKLSGKFTWLIACKNHDDDTDDQYKSGYCQEAEDTPSKCDYVSHPRNTALQTMAGWVWSLFCFMFWTLFCDTTIVQLSHGGEVNVVRVEIF